MGQSPLTRAAANCEIPHCAACAYAKANCHPTVTKTHVQVPSKSFALKCNELYPGQRVSMDHFKVKHHGRLSVGRTHPDRMCSGSCIFVDHATGFVHVEHLVNFTTTKTIQAKHHFEKSMVTSVDLFKSINLIMGCLLRTTFWMKLRKVYKTLNSVVSVLIIKTALFNVASNLC